MLRFGIFLKTWSSVVPEIVLNLYRSISFSILFHTHFRSIHSQFMLLHAIPFIVAPYPTSWTTSFEKILLNLWRKTGQTIIDTTWPNTWFYTSGNRDITYWGERCSTFNILPWFWILQMLLKAKRLYFCCFDFTGRRKCPWGFPTSKKLVWVTITYNHFDSITWHTILFSQM